MKSLFSKVAIRSLGYVLPPHRVTSNEIESRLLGSSFPVPMNSIESVTGIRERRVWEPGMTPSRGATLAGEEALKKAGIDRSKVEILVRAGIWRQYDEPAEACMVHRDLGLSEHCSPHDVVNACVGFLTGMQHVAMAIEMGSIRFGLVVCAETSSLWTEKAIEDLRAGHMEPAERPHALASLTMGSGAVAMLLCHLDEFPEGPRLEGLATYSATQYSEICLGRDGWMRTEARNLLDATLKTSETGWMTAAQALEGWNYNNIDLFIPHQPSAKHIDLNAEKIGIDPRKLIRTYPFLGNVAAASLPLSLALSLKLGYIKPNHNVALVGFGSGLNLVGGILKFGRETDLVGPSDDASLGEIPPLLCG